MRLFNKIFFIFFVFFLWGGGGGGRERYSEIASLAFFGTKVLPEFDLEKQCAYVYHFIDCKCVEVPKTSSTLRCN